MSKIDGSVLLVGSVPGDDAEGVMRFCSDELGARIAAIPDGETGFRKVWINFLAARLYSRCDALETINRPEPVDPAAADEWRGAGEDWIPKGYHDHWQFRVRPGQRVRFDQLGYAEEAIASYATLQRLRDEGAVPPGKRFLVAMPMAESAVRPFLGLAGPDNYREVAAAYTEAMGREVARMAEHIPPSELAVQWDVCMEMLALDLDDEHPGLFPWRLPGAPLDRYREAVATCSSYLPDDTALGLHFCYGDLGHRHVVEPRDLANATTIAAASVEAIRRDIDFCHIPVPKERADDDYFRPLASWPQEAGKLYLGLIHHTGGVEASHRRMQTAARHIADFGVATECGFGRRPHETLPALMQIHREIADAL